MVMLKLECVGVTYKSASSACLEQATSAEIESILDTVPNFPCGDSGIDDGDAPVGTAIPVTQRRQILPTSPSRVSLPNARPMPTRQALRVRPKERLQTG